MSVRLPARTFSAFFKTTHSADFFVDEIKVQNSITKQLFGTYKTIALINIRFLFEENLQNPAQQK